MAQVEFAFPVGVGCIRRLTKKHPSGAFFCVSQKKSLPLQAIIAFYF